MYSVKIVMYINNNNLYNNNDNYVRDKRTNYLVPYLGNPCKMSNAVTKFIPGHYPDHSD